MLTIARIFIAAASLFGGANANASSTFEEGAAAYRAGDFKTAISKWQPLAEHGDSLSQFNLGCMTAKGQGMQADRAQAMFQFKSAAVQGDVFAQQWLRGANADPAMNPDGAWFSWKGTPLATKGFRLAFLAPLRDGTEMVWLCRTDAEDGASMGFQIGFMLENGRMGLNQDYEKAAEFYEIGVERNQKDAMTHLAYLYGSGRGVPQDNNRAISLFRQASRLGDRVALANVGHLYNFGLQGIEKDKVLAYVYLKLAMSAGEKNIAPNEFNALKDTLSANQFGEANLIIEDWKPGQPFPEKTIFGKSR